MTGSLQVKKETYYMVLNTYDANGKRKLRWISTGLPAKGNKKRAEKMLRDTLREYEQRESATANRCDMRFSDWVRHWLEEAEKRVDVITYQGYKVNVDNHILPYFDDLGIALSDMTRQVLQTYIDHKAKHGRKDGTGGLAPKSIQHYRSILHQTLKAAVMAGHLPSNPCEDLIIPKKQRYEYQFYNDEQLECLFNAVRDDPIYPMIRVTAVYGLRRSELLGLQWDSVDFNANTLTIKHTVVKVLTTVQKDTTKSTASYRAFPLLPDIRQLLLQLKAKEKENRRLMGREYEESPYIFKWASGKSYSPDYVSHRFLDLLRQNELPHIRFHDLRHSCASLLIAQGFGLKDVQEWFGHADITLTANTYSHLDMKRKQTIAQSLAGALSGKC